MAESGYRHGTGQGYSRHHRDGTRVCFECSEFHAMYQRARRIRLGVTRHLSVPVDLVAALIFDPAAARERLTAEFGAVVVAAVCGQDTGDEEREPE